MISMVPEDYKRTYSLVVHDKGWVICEKMSGAVLYLKHPAEVESLKAVLSKIDTSDTASGESPPTPNDKHSGDTNGHT